MPEWLSRASSLISGITKGILFSMRKAELLSITTQPFRRACSAKSKDCCDPALNMAKSRFLNDSGVVSWISSMLPSAFISLPADFAEASNLISETGRSRFSKRLIISWPTAPVAPTMPTRYFFNEFRMFIQ